MLVKRGGMIKMNFIKPDIALLNVLTKLPDENGSQLVEFALALLVLLTMMFGIMYFSLAMYSYHFVTYAAQEGARFAIVRGNAWQGKGSCSTSAPPNFSMKYACVAQSSDVQNYVKSIATPLINSSQITVTTTWPGSTPTCTKNCGICATANSQGCQVKVNVSYDFGYAVPLVRSRTLTFAGSSSKTIQE